MESSYDNYSPGPNNSTIAPQPKKKLRKRIKRRLKKWLAALAKYTVPYIYFGYIRLVWATSKVIEKDAIIPQTIFQEEPYKAVAVLWHQDVFCVPLAYQKFHPVTIASVGDAGEVISKILKLFDYDNIFRGGSSKGKKRRKKILAEFIDYFRSKTKTIAGITVDGSSGPAYRLKRGALVIAAQCRCPILLTRIWCKRRLLLPTWDRTMIPLPFNQIVVYVHGVYQLPPGMEDAEIFEAYRRFIENELLELSYRIFQLMDHKVDRRCLPFFPKDWQPSWPSDNGVEF